MPKNEAVFNSDVLRSLPCKGLRESPLRKSTLKFVFLLAQFCAAPYKQSCEAALPLLPFLGVSSLMNWPGGFAGLFFGFEVREAFGASATRSK
jgi:hypothetical protein